MIRYVKKENIQYIYNIVLILAELLLIYYFQRLKILMKTFFKEVL